MPHASRLIGNTFDSLWQLHKCRPLDFTYCASSHKRMYLRQQKSVCVCVFLLACLRVVVGNFRGNETFSFEFKS